MRVLVADDTNLMRSMLGNLIAKMDFTVKVVCDGAEALEAAFAEDYDIFVIDWEMPKLNGIQVVERLRNHPRTMYGHIILVTANQEPERLIHALDGGADELVRKPIHQASLLARRRAGARHGSMRHPLPRRSHTDKLTGGRQSRAGQAR